MKTIVMVAIFATLVIATTATATNVNATSLRELGRSLGNTLEDLGNAGDQALQGYQDGIEDGERAAVNGQSRECPRSDSLSGYCLGFTTGYDSARHSQDQLNRINSNNDNNGNREDDGEFVDTPKRTIDGGD